VKADEDWVKDNEPSSGVNANIDDSVDNQEINSKSLDFVPDSDIHLTVHSNLSPSKSDGDIIENISSSVVDSSHDYNADANFSPVDEEQFSLPDSPVPLSPPKKRVRTRGGKTNQLTTEQQQQPCSKQSRECRSTKEITGWCQRRWTLFSFINSTKL